MHPTLLFTLAWVPLLHQSPPRAALQLGVNTSVSLSRMLPGRSPCQLPCLAARRLSGASYCLVRLGEKPGWTRPTPEALPNPKCAVALSGCSWCHAGRSSTMPQRTRSHPGMHKAQGKGAFLQGRSWPGGSSVPGQPQDHKVHTK